VFIRLGSPRTTQGDVDDSSKDDGDHTRQQLNEEEQLRALCSAQEVLFKSHHVLVSVPRYTGMEHSIPAPGLRVAISAGHTPAELIAAAEHIREVLGDTLRSLHARAQPPHNQ